MVPPRKAYLDDALRFDVDPLKASLVAVPVVEDGGLAEFADVPRRPSCFSVRIRLGRSGGSLKGIHSPGGAREIMAQGSEDVAVDCPTAARLRPRDLAKPSRKFPKRHDRIGV